MKKQIILYILLYSVVHSFAQEDNIWRKNIVVSHALINVLYKGVDNPIGIAVSGIEYDEQLVTISNGSISNRRNGEYIVRIKDGQKTRVEISVKKGDSIIHIGTKEYICKNLPDPVAYIHERKSNVISKSHLLALTGIRASLDNFDFDVRFKVISFTLSVNVRGFTHCLNSKSNRFTQEQKALMRKAKYGNYVLFENIKAVGPDGVVRRLNNIYLQLR